MTHSILAVLATKPDGMPGSPLSMDELGPYLQKHYKGDAARRERHRLRDEFYRDGGVQYMCSVLDNVFQHDVVRELRKRWIPHARFSNDLKSIINKNSTVYSEPATRKVGGSPANEAQFQAHVEALKLDEVLDYSNRMLNLHRAVLIGPSVWRDLDGNGTLSLDVVTPANAVAVMHPNNTARVVAWLIRQDFRSARSDWERVPHWQLWSDHEAMYLDKDFVPIEGTHRLHTLGVNPWIALTYHAEAIPGFWPGEEGEDLVAGHISIWFAGISMLKETKSATKQEVITGGVNADARGTPHDTDVPREHAEGVTSTVVDMSMDPEQFIKPSDHILERVANNYNLSVSALRHDMQSADAQEAQRQPLLENRRRQIKTFRRGEHALVALIALVLSVDASDVAFTVESFEVDFGEPQVLMTLHDRVDLFIKLRTAGVTHTLAFIRFLNPDLKTDDAARLWMDECIKVETERVAKMRTLQALSGAMGEAAPGTNPQAGVPQGPVADRGGEDDEEMRPNQFANRGRKPGSTGSSTARMD